MVVKLLVLDCDGILLDSRKSVVRALRFALRNHGYPLSKEVLHDLGNGPIEDVLPVAGVKKEEIAVVAKEFRAEKLRRAFESRAAPWVSALRKLDVPKVGLTNNITKIIKKELRHVGIDFLEEVLGGEKKESKLVRFRRILKKYGVRAGEVVYVDDKLVGVALSRKIGCVSVLVAGRAAWASSRDQILAGADFVVGDLRGVAKIVRELG
jgi:phosphoglycolate phosphatase-like HAD superfamily hydrolase